MCWHLAPPPPQHAGNEEMPPPPPPPPPQSLSPLLLMHAFQGKCLISLSHPLHLDLPWRRGGGGVNASSGAFRASRYRLRGAFTPSVTHSHPVPSIFTTSAGSPATIPASL